MRAAILEKFDSRSRSPTCRCPLDQVDKLMTRQRDGKVRYRGVLQIA